MDKGRTYRLRGLAATAALTLGLAAGGCGGGETDSVGASASQVNASAAQVSTVTVSWAANRERAVNTQGGGYRVYYARDPGFDPGDAGVSMVDVPYRAGSRAPVQARLRLASGRYYLRIAAYSALTPRAGAHGSESQPSAPSVVVVP